MKKSIIFDINYGASGDMLLGALLDLGLDLNALKTELNKLSLPYWDISIETMIKDNLKGVQAKVKCLDNQPTRNLSEIIEIIKKCELTERIKNNILDIFQRLAIAEANVHGTTVERIHFHEVGAIDSIIDISAFCISLELLKIESFYFNEFCFGSGSIKSAHGEFPIPVPAVVELTRGLKSRITDRKGEIVTPTAAAILTSLGVQINELLSFTLLNNGIGFGTRAYSFPSFTRALLVKIEDTDVEEIYQLECNIDDMNPQIYPYLIDKLQKAGALDTYISQISMKKGRPGNLITIITKKENMDVLKEILYRETTTLGIRILKIVREKLDRIFDTIYIGNSAFRIKKGYFKDKVVNIQPEFEDCKKVAEEKEIPIKEIIDQVLSEYLKKNDSS